MTEGFTATQASRLTGCTPSQLRYWDTVRLVQPSIQRTGGRPGVPRLYAFQDLVQLRAIRSLKDNGMSLQRIRRAWGYLRRKGVDPRQSKLATDGGSIFEVLPEDDQIVDVLLEGQLAFFVKLDEIGQDVEEDDCLFEFDRDRFLAVVRDTRDDTLSRMASAAG